MTKEEMKELYLTTSGKVNYQEAQRRIKEAMERGENYVYLPKSEFKDEFNWTVSAETITRLREDGFDINKVWQPYEYYSVEWYED